MIALESVTDFITMVHLQSLRLIYCNRDVIARV